MILKATLKQDASPLLGGSGVEFSIEMMVDDAEQARDHGHMFLDAITAFAEGMAEAADEASS